jgi:lipopolysaccharide export LptBFGC system permease protein LptF
MGLKMKHFTILLFAVPATVLLGLAIFLGNEKEKKMGLLILLVTIFFVARRLVHHLFWQWINSPPN